MNQPHPHNHASQRRGAFRLRELVVVVVLILLLLALILPGVQSARESLYNALYMPNSNWPGPDSNHPGVVLVVFGDGHSSTIGDGIDFSVWASLNTRAGGETINGDF